MLIVALRQMLGSREIRREELRAELELLEVEILALQRSVQLFAEGASDKVRER